MAVDPELTNYRCGIDVTFGGTAEKGTGYYEEYLYHDKTIQDRKIVYIKSDTLITMGHNSTNVAGNVQNSNLHADIGADGQDGVPNSGDEGIIRFKVDKDLWLDVAWPEGTLYEGEDNESVHVSNVEEYTAPFAFNDLEYETSVPVVGTTGPHPTLDIVNDRGEYYHRGMIDSVGDEWHVIYYADDDTTILEGLTGLTNPSPVGSPIKWIESQISDGKSCLFVVNPKTPCLSPRVTGDAQFYTTRPKANFTPIIYDQTTYIRPGTGAVTIELRDINGNNVFYRINGGSFTDAGDSTVTLDDTDFSSGSNTLEYYYAGNEAYTKTRIIVKDPTFPSANENHGDKLWGGSSGWTAQLSKFATEPWSSAYSILATNGTFSGQDALDAVIGQSSREPFRNGAFVNALVAKVEGLGNTRSGGSYTYEEYAKLGLLNNPRQIDSNGHEVSHSNSSGPCGELHYRGYYDANLVLDGLFTYTTLMGFYRSDQQSGGITPIEDYMLRDMFAEFANEAMQWGGNWNQITRGGMWDTARRCAAIIIGVVMPEYDTPYFGASGFDGVTSGRANTPYPDVTATWKQVLYDQSVTVTAWPNLAHPMGLYEYNITSEDANWYDRPAYASNSLMGGLLCSIHNILELNGFTGFSRIDTLFAKGVTSPGITSELYNDPDEQLVSFWPASGNSRFPTAGPLNVAKMESLESTGDLDLHKFGPTGLIWYSDDVEAAMLSSPPHYTSNSAIALL